MLTLQPRQLARLQALRKVHKMSSIAILMLCVSIALIWGGLGLALLHLSRHPDEEASPAPSAGNQPKAPWAS